ncbi:acylneuraminate cytidylyltransferase [Microbacterium paludicola]|uniref:N-acylneuraminate cytidylyltransferase n=1 Tax=Microbacterium paludicola TaxID=300019 RepID=A0A4Y9FQK0_9MICO|nr:acylneuraminate cytidylyltransferase [Microbacterium paludicola]MBF0817552.1 acylneuraminate cytidylyltransferase [Microbacterium paludicola]TFU30783.1 acylneuraminate cytidylyltransferase [Microbacterium paludicola]
MTDVTSGPETVAIIPARGGSKGVPRKNVLPVAGVPIVARAVGAARRAGVPRVFVSTDDAEIAAAARAAGAEVVDRPADIAGDTATSESAVLHAMGEIERRGIAIGTVAFLQATSPFIPSDALAEGVRMVADGAYDSAFSAYETYGFLWARGADGGATAVNHDASFRPRRQDREPHYMETGAFYVFDAAGFRQAKHRFFGRIGIVEVPENSAIEIDNLFEFEMAGALAHLLGQPEVIPVDAIVTDFDGVHTDDAVHVDTAGNESVRVLRGDGMGVSLLRKAGIPLLILSTETNGVVRARADKLRVPVIHGLDDKATALREWAQQNGVNLSRTAYVGNDVNDLEAMALVGWPIAVADARPEVRAAARVVLSRAGGQGAVREVIDRVLAARD